MQKQIEVRNGVATVVGSSSSNNNNGKSNSNNGNGSEGKDDKIIVDVVVPLTRDKRQAELTLIMALMEVLRSTNAQLATTTTVFNNFFEQAVSTSDLNEEQKGILLYELSNLFDIHQNFADSLEVLSKKLGQL